MVEEVSEGSSKWFIKEFVHQELIINNIPQLASQVVDIKRIPKALDDSLNEPNVHLEMTHQ